MAELTASPAALTWRCGASGLAGKRAGETAPFSVEQWRPV